MPVTTGPAMEDSATQEFMRSSIPWVAGFVVVGAVLVAVGLLAMIAWGWHEWFNLAILVAPPDSDARFIMSPWRDVKKKKKKVHWWFRR